MSLQSICVCGGFVFCIAKEGFLHRRPRTSFSPLDVSSVEGGALYTKTKAQLLVGHLSSHLWRGNATG